jgi:hypothetical protein
MWSEQWGSRFEQRATSTISPRAARPPPVPAQAFDKAEEMLWMGEICRQMNNLNLQGVFY